MTKLEYLKKEKIIANVFARTSNILYDPFIKFNGKDAGYLQDFCYFCTE